jgi:predicted NUDIX family NTP pyrophosphohydrolase
MKKQSAGILVYRRSDSNIEVLLAHPGGPFWGKKDTWTIPKGEADVGEDLLTTAFREFEEEMGFPPPSGTLLSLGNIDQDGKKVNHVWAVEGNTDLSEFKSNTFSMEWPPKSGKRQDFPENDKAAWFLLSEARQLVFARQRGFFDQLAEKLNITLDEPPTQQSLL